MPVTSILVDGFAILLGMWGWKGVLKAWKCRFGRMEVKRSPAVLRFHPITATASLQATLAWRKQFIGANLRQGYFYRCQSLPKMFRGECIF